MSRSMTIVSPDAVVPPLRETLAREWLDTNGIGGYASSTAAGCHTRRYHGLLVASLQEPPGRYVLLSKFEDSVVADEKEFFLTCHQYAGALFPKGHSGPAEFRHSPHPQFRYRIGDTVIVKEVLLVHGENTVLVRYRVEAGRFRFTLRLKPFLAYRDYHSLTRENLFLQVRTFPIPRGFKIQPYNGMPPLHLTVSAPFQFYPSPGWYRNFEYPVEQERGFDCHEDLFQPGLFEIPLKKGACVIVAASVSPPRGSLAQMWEKEVRRRRQAAARDDKVVATFRSKGPRDAARRLMENARHFVIRWPSGRPAVVAGYHWFEDWGRDTLIALPGLTFCTGRLEEGIAILAALGRHERNGLLPNCFGRREEDTAYNAADASLWYFWCVQQMIRYGGAMATVRESLWPVMKSIIAHYMRGTDFGIGMNDDGLIRAGDRQTPVTWMDARVGGQAVTPRHGCAVDINALWYNAVCFARELGTAFADFPPAIAELPERVGDSFRRAFWIESGMYLADAVSDGVPDPSIRPNQILAVSLPYSPLDAEQAAAVVEQVRAELLTPFGLRTLSPRSGKYQGQYAGNAETRDRAYHQGTVWPWLLGHFGEALLRVSTNEAAARRFLLETLDPLLRDHVLTAGLGCVSEIFDGDPPHHPNGCIAQAWSVSELIRLLCLVNASTATGKTRCAS